MTTTPESSWLEEIVKALDEKIQETKESKAFLCVGHNAHNSYGAGMCDGERETLQRVKYLLNNGEWPDF